MADEQFHLVSNYAPTGDQPQAIEQLVKEHGYSEEAAQAVWDILVPFSGYAFNKAHSAAYGLISYWTAYLKTHYPVEFMAALLQGASTNKAKTALYLGEARRMGIHVRQRQKKMDDAIKQIELRTGKAATDEELANELGLTEDELENWQSQLKATNLVSLNEFEESGSEQAIDHLHARFSQPEDVVAEEELKKTLVESLDLLTEKERKVIELYYYEEMTLKEISKILEVSESRISQLHTKALVKMKKTMGTYMDILID